jgi:hypothetical protein
MNEKEVYKPYLFIQKDSTWREVDSILFEDIYEVRAYMSSKYTRPIVISGETTNMSSGSTKEQQ